MYSGFEKRNFKVSALFDSNSASIGSELPGIGIIESIEELENIVRERGIEILVVCVPVSSVKSVFEKIKKSGVKAVLNFAPFKLISTDDICVQNVDFTTELEALSYKLRVSETEISDEGVIV
jgi:redox-sensing transcriptional repressor